jgi:prepilin-type N-terminal cleavage/methylation domain-containing protein
MQTVWRKSMRNNNGFSLYELMTVIAIIGILSAIAIPNMIAWRNNAKLGDGTRDVYSALVQARSRAAKENANVTVLFAPNGGFDGEILLFVDNGDGSVDADLASGMEPNPYCPAIDFPPASTSIQRPLSGMRWCSKVTAFLIGMGMLKYPIRPVTSEKCGSAPPVALRSAILERKTRAWFDRREKSSNGPMSGLSKWIEKRKTTKDSPSSN